MTWKVFLLILVIALHDSLSMQCVALSSKISSALVQARRSVTENAFDQPHVTGANNQS